MEADLEIEALLSIFGDEIEIDRNYHGSLITIRKKVRPNDEEGVSSASVVVEFQLGPKYPEVSPNIRVVNPRGISEQSHRQLIGELNQRLSENAGLPVIFDILQHCADFIFEHQHSSSLLCPICLCPMASYRVSSTPCEHYVHSYCLDLHIQHTRKQLGEKLSARDFKMCSDIDKSLRCPVCRVVIEKEVDPILPSEIREHSQKPCLEGCETVQFQSCHQEDSHDEFEFDWEKWRQQQASLKIIYEKQKEKGGIIDLDEERKKALVTEDTVVLLNYELETLCTEPSISGVSALPISGCSDVPSGNATVLNYPPGLVDKSPAVLATNASKSDGYHGDRSSNYHGRRDGGGQKRKPFINYKQKNSRGFVKTSSRPTFSNTENTGASCFGPSNTGAAHSSSKYSISEVKVKQRRGPSLRKNFESNYTKSDSATVTHE